MLNAAAPRQRGWRYRFRWERDPEREPPLAAVLHVEVRRQGDRLFGRDGLAGRKLPPRPSASAAIRRAS